MGRQFRQADAGLAGQCVALRQKRVWPQLMQQDAGEVRGQAEIVGQAEIDCRIAEPPPSVSKVSSRTTTVTAGQRCEKARISAGAK